MKRQIISLARLGVMLVGIGTSLQAFHQEREYEITVTNLPLVNPLRPHLPPLTPTASACLR